MPLSELDYFDTLGVNPGATEAQIKDAYRRQSRQWHPDKAAEGDREVAQEMFIQIKRAYDVLAHGPLRAVYTLWAGEFVPWARTLVAMPPYIRGLEGSGREEMLVVQVHDVPAGMETTTASELLIPLGDFELFRERLLTKGAVVDAETALEAVNLMQQVMGRARIRALSEVVADEDGALFGADGSWGTLPPKEEIAAYGVLLLLCIGGVALVKWGARESKLLSGESMRSSAHGLSRRALERGFAAFYAAA